MSKITSKRVKTITFGVSLATISIFATAIPAAANYPPNPKQKDLAYILSTQESAPSTCPTTAPSGTIRTGENVYTLCTNAIKGATTYEAASAIRYAFAHLGSPYSQWRRDSINPNIYDCSSLVGRAFTAGGAKIKRSWNNYADPFYPLFGWTGAYVSNNYANTNLTRVSYANRKPGDIIIQFNGPDPSQSAGNAGHAQIYLGNGRIIQSSGPLNVSWAGKWSFQNEWYFRYNSLGGVNKPNVPPPVIVDTRPVFLANNAKYGIKNSKSVRNLQTLLLKKKYATTKLRLAGVTGTYSLETKISVRKVQLSLGYTGADADGILGPYSAAHLGLHWVQ